MENLQSLLTEKIRKILSDFSFPDSDSFVVQSNRPDLSDYQCNIAMTLAKQLKKPPREIAQQIADALSSDPAVAKVTVDGPGFINITIADALFSHFDFTYPTPGGKTVVVDYGGPNIAKRMHVGHLRAAIIGESLKRIVKACGNTAIGDVHFGDWGTPMGMLIVQLRRERPELSFFQEPFVENDYEMGIDELTELYQRAAAGFKADDSFKEEARVATSDLQNGRPGYVALWRVFKDASVRDVKKTYDKLDVNFELWLGESDVNDLLQPLLDNLVGKGLAVLSEGATIIPLAPKGANERAPLILKKTDGAYTYAATDLATIVNRMRMDPRTDAMLYVVDIRQKEHFEQVFEVARMAQLVPETVSLEHIAFGTVNGADGKPFKTREGGVMTLEDLIRLSEEKVRENMPEASSAAEAEDLERQAEVIALGALKYQDLKNPRVSDYLFDIDNFTKSEGKTGTYLQYAVARINSILAKSGDADAAAEIIVSHPLERELLVVASQWPEALQAAYERREPSVISGYLYKVAQKFSSFYSELSIVNEEDEKLRNSRILIIKRIQELLTRGMHLLGIETIERIIKKQ